MKEDKYNWISEISVPVERLMSHKRLQSYVKHIGFVNKITFYIMTQGYCIFNLLLHLNKGHIQYFCHIGKMTELNEPEIQIFLTAVKAISVTFNSSNIMNQNPYHPLLYIKIQL